MISTVPSVMNVGIIADANLIGERTPIRLALPDVCMRATYCQRRAHVLPFLVRCVRQRMCFSSASGVCVCVMRGEITACVCVPVYAAVRMLGYSKRELVGHNISMFIPEPFGSVHDTYVKRFVRTGNQVRLWVPILCDCGCVCTCRTCASGSQPLQWRALCV